MTFIPAVVETIRSLSAASTLGTYVAVGSALANPVSMFCLTNNTNGDMFFTTDGVNDQFFVAAGSFKLLDLSTNNFMALRIGTTFSVRRSTVPTTGAVYIETVYGKGS